MNTEEGENTFDFDTIGVHLVFMVHVGSKKRSMHSVLHFPHQLFSKLQKATQPCIDFLRKNTVRLEISFQGDFESSGTDRGI